MNNRKHYDQIDALKGIAIFLVILGHSIIVYPINLHENQICKNIFDFISTIHMPLFFIIAGYNFNYSGDYKKYIVKKVKRLLIPYFVFSILEIIPRLLFSGLVNKQTDINELIINMFLYGGNYWFIYTLFIIYLIFPIIAKTNNKINTVLIVLSLLLNIYNPGYGIFTINLVCRYLIYFVIGYVISINIDVFEKGIQSKVKLIALVLISIILWILIFMYRNYINYNLSSFLMVILGTASLYYLVNIKLVCDLFKQIGKYSLPLFLLNGFILVISRTFVCKFTSNPMIIISFNLFFDICVSYISIKYIFERNKCLKALIGQ